MASSLQLHCREPFSRCSIEMSSSFIRSWLLKMLGSVKITPNFFAWVLFEDAQQSGGFSRAEAPVRQYKGINFSLIR